jgi:hypothetical protein
MLDPRILITTSEHGRLLAEDKQHKDTSNNAIVDAIERLITVTAHDKKGIGLYRIRENVW